MVAAEKGVICTCNVTTRKSLFELTREKDGFAMGLGLDQPTRNIYWGVGLVELGGALYWAWWSSSKSLVRAVIIASSLASHNSFFFPSSDKPCFWRPRISAFIWSYLSISDSIRRNSSSDILPSVSAVEIRSAMVFIFDAARTDHAFVWSIRPINYPPAPSNPYTIAPAWMPMATGTAMIVDKANARSGQAHASHRKRGVKSVYDVSPAPVFLVQRGSEVSFFFETRFDIGYMLKTVIVSGLKWRVEAIRATLSPANRCLNDLLTNNDRGLIRRDLPGRKSSNGTNMDLIDIQSVWCWMPPSVNRTWGVSCTIIWTPTSLLACAWVHLSLKPGNTSTKSSGLSPRKISRSIVDVTNPRPMIFAGENSETILRTPCRVLFVLSV